MVKFYLKWSPLVLTSILHKVGFLMVILQYFGAVNSFLCYFAIFSLNLLSSFIMKDLPVLIPPRNNKYTLNQTDDDLVEKNPPIRIREKMFLSYSNMFVIGGCMKTTR